MYLAIFVMSDWSACARCVPPWRLCTMYRPPPVCISHRVRYFAVSVWHASIPERMDSRDISLGQVELNRATSTLYLWSYETLTQGKYKRGTVTLRFGFELRRIANWALLLELPNPAKLAIRKGNLLYVLKQHGLIITHHTMQQVWYVKPFSFC
jgi:hypothetical protein